MMDEVRQREENDVSPASAPGIILSVALAAVLGISVVLAVSVWLFKRKKR